MNRRPNPAQLGFSFPEPQLPWLAVPVKPVAPCAITLPLPLPDARGVIDSGLSDATRSSDARVTDLLRAYADAA